MSEDAKKWDGLTLEEAIQKTIREGSMESLKTLGSLISLLPMEKQARYREIARREIQALQSRRGMTDDKDTPSKAEP